MPTGAIVTRESASQRKHYRLTAPAAVAMGGYRHNTRDWGIGGFSIDQFEAAPPVGQIMHVQFLLNFQHFEISFPARAAIVHHSARKIGTKFLNLGEREESLIKYFASTIVSGEMVVVGNALQRVDRPVTPVASIAGQHSPEQKQRHGLRRRFIGGAYIAAGLLLAAILILTLMNNLLRVDVQTAVINTGIEQIVSRDVGRVSEVYVQSGIAVSAGQPLLRVEDDQVAHWIVTANQELGIARTELHDIQSRRLLAEKKFNVYQSISSDQIASAKAQVVALTAERDAAALEANRVKALVDQGIAAPQLYDVQKALVAGKQGALESALAEFKTAQSGANATDRGLMFSANYLVGDVATLKAQEASAAERVQVAEATLQQALQREKELVYRAPYAGTVVRIYKSAGMTLDRGEQIVVLRHGTGEHSIDAYLTQEEATFVQAGVNGVAYVPGTDKRYGVKVVEIDRTRGFLKELESPKPLQPAYNWRGAEDKSAYVKLAFVSLSEKDGEELVGGMPVFVNLPKKRYLPFFGMFNWHQDGTGNMTSQPQGSGKSESGPISFRLTPAAMAGVHTEATVNALWPQNSLIIHDARALSKNKDFNSIRTEVFEEADTALRDSPAPVETLRSSGVTDQQDPLFQATLKAFADADKFALLATAYCLSHQAKYLGGARGYVLAWAKVNKPTGQPIDETRLDGFLWGIDLLRPNFNADENAKINEWLERWLAAKRAYKFGPVTETNNHKTHQLKIIIMLDKLLGRDDAYQFDLTNIKKQLGINLLPNGESIDYQQRDAMHYHIYDLEAWNEIALVTGCCGENIDRAFSFFEKKTIDDPNHIEFANTTAPIDRKRAEAGFGYAQSKNFDVTEAARAIFSYATLPGRRVDKRLWQAALQGTARRNLFYLARYYAWGQR